ncbi:hypothetical protein TNCV_1513721 [Trichonephila clavipes]|nr:hypothetical protein TNCV_1513721 [Trichonephila clavipes]
MPNVNKMPDQTKLLKQLALEVTDGIPLDAVKIYTDGSLPGNEVADDPAKAATSDSVAAVAEWYSLKFYSKCHLFPASPEHILDCLGLAFEDVHVSPLLALDFARVNGLMDDLI